LSQYSGTYQSTVIGERFPLYDSGPVDDEVQDESPDSEEEAGVQEDEPQPPPRTIVSPPKRI